MKNNYSRLIYIFFILLASFISQKVQGQDNIKWKYLPDLAKSIKDEVPEGKALLVFESIEDFSINESFDNIIPPQKDGLLYKLLIDIKKTSSRTIKITHKTAGEIQLFFGPQIRQELNTILPALKTKEIRYFRLSLSKVLICDDVTPDKIKNDNNFQLRYKKEALIILDVIPTNLKLKIFADSLTDTIHKDARYFVYVKSSVQKIMILSENYDTTIIDFSNKKLVTKDIKFYRIIAPHNNEPQKQGRNYSIESIPSGALIQIAGYPGFNDVQHKTPEELNEIKSSEFIVPKNFRSIVGWFQAKQIEGASELSYVQLEYMKLFIGTDGNRILMNPNDFKKFEGRFPKNNYTVIPREYFNSEGLLLKTSTDRDNYWLVTNKIWPRVNFQNNTEKCWLEVRYKITGPANINFGIDFYNANSNFKEGCKTENFKKQGEWQTKTLVIPLDI